MCMLTRLVRAVPTVGGGGVDVYATPAGIFATPLSAVKSKTPADVFATPVGFAQSTPGSSTPGARPAVPMQVG
jgi:hypothetical protein